MSEEAKPKIYVQQKDVVLPGDLIAEGTFESNSVYIYNLGNKYYSSLIGIVEVKENKVMFYPKETVYIPKVNDIVIGLITDVGPTYWEVDINGPYEGQLPVAETPLKQVQANISTMRKFLSVGDFAVLKVLLYDRLRDPLLTMKGKGLGKISSGKVIDLPLHVVAGLLRRKSIVETIVRETNTEILLANNARVWIRGSDEIMEDLAILALKKIERRDPYEVNINDVIEYIKSEKSKRGLSENESD